MNTPTKKIELHRIKNAVLGDALEEDKVVVEQVITIQVDAVGDYTVLCTPSDIKVLVVGFLFAEGIIKIFDDIVAISVDEFNIQVKVKHPAQATGKENLLQTIPPCNHTLTFPAADLGIIIKKLQDKQEIFKQTGGAHAAGIFNASGEIITFNEDIGRHNALDKAIGNCLLKNYATHGCGVALSSRISFEMVAKAARAGIEMIVAVSAPSSLAIEAAKKWNMTLCGFVRGDDANVYTGVERVSDLAF
jgi:FdhD protein